MIPTKYLKLTKITVFNYSPCLLCLSFLSSSPRDTAQHDWNIVGRADKPQTNTNFIYLDYFFFQFFLSFHSDWKKWEKTWYYLLLLKFSRSVVIKEMILDCNCIWPSRSDIFCEEILMYLYYIFCQIGLHHMFKVTEQRALENVIYIWLLYIAPDKWSIGRYAFVQNCTNAYLVDICQGNSNE